MNAVFQCPRCNTPLGTSDDPRPDPLPPCPNCGWGTATASEARPSAKLGFVAAGLLLLVVGGVAGALSGLMLFNILAWVAFGPVCTVGVAKMFPQGWLVMPVCYGAGFALGMGLVASRVGPMASGPDAVSAYLLALGIAGFSVVLAWFIGWLRHTD